MKATPKMPDKFRAHDLNIVHKRFVDSEMDLEDYVLRLLEHLSRDYSEADASDFLTTHAVAIETGTFRPTHGKFAKFLDAQWNSWCDRHGVARSVPDTFLQPNAPEAPVVVKRATSVNIESAWQKYLLGGVEAKNELFAIVSRFMMMGARSRMIGLADIHDAPEDAAQKAAMAVLREIESFQGKNSKTGKSCSFYSWMRKIMSNKAADSLGKNIKTAKKRVPLMVYGEDGSVDDNPALYRDEHLQYLHKLPEFIKGADRLICSYIRQGLDYEQIGKTMGITEAGVKNRMARIRAKTHKLKLTR